jgi:hypothetical protein
MLIGDLKPKAPYTNIIREGKSYPAAERAALLDV